MRQTCTLTEKNVPDDLPASFIAEFKREVMGHVQVPFNSAC